MKKSTKDPWASIDAIMKQESEPPSEDGWFTLLDFCERYGRNKEGTAARRILHRMVGDGILEARQWRSQMFYRAVD